MRNTRRACIHVEAFEPRTLLNAAAPARPNVAADVTPQIYPPPLLLTGQVRGVAVVSRQGIPDVGDMYSVLGTGRVSPMGQVSAQGMLQTTSLTGRAIGTLTLTNPFGQAKLQVTGPSRSVSSGFPQNSDFVVTQATGRFTNLQGTGGNIELHFDRGPNGTLAFQMKINPVIILTR